MAFYGNLNGLSRSEVARRRERLLATVGLAEWGNTSIKKYSKGMQQRLGLALAMLHELRMAPALRGARGRPPADEHAAADTVRRFAQLAAEIPGLADLEINPLLVGPAGAFALDVRGRLEERTP